MVTLVVEPPGRVASRVAGIVETYVASAPLPRLGLATGGTMLDVYETLIQHWREGRVDFSRSTAFLLDEYVGLDRQHAQSYRNVIRYTFTSHVDFRLGSVIGPDGIATDPVAEAHRYEQKLRAAPVGLQLLGIGRNGHIAFNEPGSHHDTKTRVVSLSPDTRRANSRFFHSLADVPTQAITQGISTILKAHHIVLVARGEGKARALEAALLGDVSRTVPGSALQGHSNVTVVADAAAARYLS